MRTVTIPIEEYEELINAQRTADAKMRQAENMIEKRRVRVDIVTTLRRYFGMTEVDTCYVFSGENDFPVEGKIKELVNEIEKSNDLAEHYQKRAYTLTDKIEEHNKLGFFGRLFNKIEI